MIPAALLADRQQLVVQRAPADAKGAGSNLDVIRGGAINPDRHRDTMRRTGHCGSGAVFLLVYGLHIPP